MVTPNNPFQDYLSGTGNWYQALLSEMPMEHYYSAPTGMTFGGRSPRRRRFFDESYQDIYRDYIGQTGTALRQGQAPGTFMDFLKTDPWTRRFTSLPPSARGRTGMATNPRTRFLYNY